MSRNDLLVFVRVAGSIGQNAALRYEHGPKAHGHQLILGQIHQIALICWRRQSHSFDDIEQTLFSRRDRKRITRGQVSAALAFE